MSADKDQGKAAKGTTASSSADKLSEAREAMKTVKEMSNLLNTGLDDETLRVCVQLLEAGVNPEALATVVQELRKETATIKKEDEKSR